MSLDPYSQCPCGSGKKLKFCCQPIVSDVEKVERFIDAGQEQQAIHLLESLRKTHRGNPLVLQHRAAIHFGHQEWAEAKGVLEELLHAHSDHAEGNVMYAWACYVEDGYQAARPALQRAFQRAAGSPSMAAQLAGSITDDMLASRKFLAAREYLTLALRWVGDDLKQRIFLSLLQLDGDRSVPYPLRGPHPLHPWSGTDEENREFAKAMRLASLTCWDSAARHFLHLAEKHPEAAALWHNAGLSRAAMGDETEAAEFLHKAAKLCTDRTAAVESETIAQLFDVTGSPGRDVLQTCIYKVGSVARLLTRLSQNDRFARKLDIPEPENDDEPALAAQYEILNHPQPAPEEVTVERASDLSRSMGWMAVYDGVPANNIPPHAMMTIYTSRKDELEAFVLLSAGGELTTDEDFKPSVSRFGLTEPFRRMEERPVVPEGVPLRIRRAIFQRTWAENIQQLWRTTPQPCLGGKTPPEAAGQAEFDVPLAAALFVLDAVTEQHDQMVDLPALFQEFGVTPLDPLHPNAETPLQSFSAMTMHRLVVSELTDDQLRFVLNREYLSHQNRFLYTVLVEAVGRPSLRDQIDLDRAYTTIFSLCRQAGRLDEAQQWLQRALEHFRSQAGAFEMVFKWESLHISSRAEDPNDPELPGLIRRYFAQYQRKIPQLSDVLGSVLMQLGVELPPGMIPEEVEPAGVASSGLWTPESVSSGGEKKLILPGQF